MPHLIAYLLPSLPHLARDAAPPITISEFHQRCEDMISADDLRRLRKVRTFQGRPRRVPLDALKRWYDREHALRNRFARLRARERNLDASKHLRAAPVDFEAEAVADEAFEMESPLEAAELLHRHRWKWLEEIELSHHFDLDALAIYLLKLKLLHTRPGRDSAAGRNWLDQRLDRADELTDFRHEP